MIRPENSMASICIAFLGAIMIVGFLLMTLKHAQVVEDLSSDIAVLKSENETYLKVIRSYTCEVPK